MNRWNMFEFARSRKIDEKSLCFNILICDEYFQSDINFDISIATKTNKNSSEKN